MSEDTAKLELNGSTYEFPVVVGTEQDRGIDISTLRSQTGGAVTLDEGFANTASTRSAITFIDGERGILRYRGYPIEQLAEESTFVEVMYLLIYGELPTREQLSSFETSLIRHTLIHEDMRRFLDPFPPDAHPMAILSAVVCGLSTFYPDSHNVEDAESREMTIHRLLAKLPTIAAFSYRKSRGLPLMYPDNALDYVSNFLRMMFGFPTEPYVVDETVRRALDVLFILHADHEQNCSTSTVRVVGSSRANLYASISAGICALWGPLHGGANQRVLEMLQQIKEAGGDTKRFIARAKDKNDSFRLMGFGHRVYKNFDPRAKVIKRQCDLILEKLGLDDPLLDIAKELEQAALEDEYFIERKLYPNVDFYSGIIYRALGFPTNMFTVLFALGRLPGWIAQWKEMIEANQRISRPRQIYMGPAKRDYVPIDKRA
ncbi:MAG: citrate synthase [Deltaproteobacteria bacterium]|nr:MAG: citrate synthase [Deltaproteobacteria bacterium]